MFYFWYIDRIVFDTQDWSKHPVLICISKRLITKNLILCFCLISKSNSYSRCPPKVSSVTLNSTLFFLHWPIRIRRLLRFLSQKQSFNRSQIGQKFRARKGRNTVVFLTDALCLTTIFTNAKYVGYAQLGVDEKWTLLLFNVQLLVHNAVTKATELIDTLFLIKTLCIVFIQNIRNNAE